MSEVGDVEVRCVASRRIDVANDTAESESEVFEFKFKFECAFEEVESEDEEEEVEIDVVVWARDEMTSSLPWRC